MCSSTRPGWAPKSQGSPSRSWSMCVKRSAKSGSRAGSSSPRRLRRLPARWRCWSRIRPHRGSRGGSGCRDGASPLAAQWRQRPGSVKNVAVWDARVSHATGGGRAHLDRVPGGARRAPKGVMPHAKVSRRHARRTRGANDLILRGYGLSEATGRHRRRRWEARSAASAGANWLSSAASRRTSGPRACPATCEASPRSGRNPRLLFRRPWVGLLAAHPTANSRRPTGRQNHELGRWVAPEPTGNVARLARSPPSPGRAGSGRTVLASQDARLKFRELAAAARRGSRWHRRRFAGGTVPGLTVEDSLS